MHIYIYDIIEKMCLLNLGTWRTMEGRHVYHVDKQSGKTL